MWKNLNEEKPENLEYVIVKLYNDRIGELYSIGGQYNAYHDVIEIRTSDFECDLTGNTLWQPIPKSETSPWTKNTDQAPIDDENIIISVFDDCKDKMVTMAGRYTATDKTVWVHTNFGALSFGDFYWQPMPDPYQGNDKTKPHYHGTHKCPHCLKNIEVIAPYPEPI